jgi:hypothetical protein
MLIHRCCGLCRAFLAVSILWTCISFAQTNQWAQIHAQDDAAWAKRSGLTQDQIRELRSLAGLTDKSSDLIDNVDAKTLAPYGLVLFATYGGSARCVNFWLLSKEGGGLKEFWKSENGGDALNFCADPKCGTPLVMAKPNRDLEVEIPSRHSGRCASDSFALLKWTGIDYSYKGVITRRRRQTPAAIEEH